MSPAGIVVCGRRQDSTLRATLLGPSLSAFLYQHSPVPVLFVPGTEVHRQAGLSLPATLRVMQARELLRKPARFQEASAAAA